MRRRLASIVVALSALITTSARASNVTEVPDNGSEQLARGGAWVARASDPLATTFNPAGLAGQPSSVTIQNSLYFHHTCFTRLRSAFDTSQDPMVDATGHFPRVCNDIAPTFNLQIGGTIRISDRLGLGLLIIGPASVGEKDFPEFVNDASGNAQAPPNRYLLIKQAGIVLFPSVGVGYEVFDNFRLGASFSWGFAKLRLASAAQSLNTDGTNSSNDVRANIQIADYFIPGFTLGALFSATPEIDLAGWYKWSDAIRATGDLGTATNYYTKQNAAGDDSKVRYGDTIFEDCGTGVANDQQKKPCGSGNNASVKATIPMEAKIGVRYHKPRMRTIEGPPDADGNPTQVTERVARPHTRDPMHDDVYDIELDVTWANDSAADTLEVRFPGDQNGKGLLPVAGVPGGEIPPIGDQRRGFHDVWGFRLGGDYVVLPDKLALRGGAFFETQAATSQYQAPDFDAAMRFGIAAGGTYRIAVGQKSAVEVMLGLSHVFYGTLEREDPKADGIQGLAGTSCNKSDPVSPTRCSDGNERYRTKWPVNLGTITNATNVINVGLAYRF
jgi:long-chain fatty acid transport protein